MIRISLKDLGSTLTHTNTQNKKVFMLKLGSIKLFLSIVTRQVHWSDIVGTSIRIIFVYTITILAFIFIFSVLIILFGAFVIFILFRFN